MVQKNSINIKKTERSDFMLTHNLNNMIIDSKQSSFSGTRFSVWRLMGTEMLFIRREKISKTRLF
jgi:hypothetical protein